MRREQPISRDRLSRELGIGEGSVRTILSRLVDEELVAIRKKGIYLTRWGVAKLANLPVTTVPSSDLMMSSCNVAVLVPRAIGKVTDGMVQRDEAMKIGGSGATTLVYSAGRLALPKGGVDVEQKFPEVAGCLRRVFDLEEGCVVVIGSSSDEKSAEEAALAGALSLL
ncbi:MAG: hypothetical protein KAT70_07880 [Thermoplasmata archaeon]|nr:hypothetical protein [Thermoplasmata archaeon]